MDTTEVVDHRVRLGRQVIYDHHTVGVGIGESGDGAAGAARACTGTAHVADGTGRARCTRGCSSIAAAGRTAPLRVFSGLRNHATPTVPHTS